MKIDSYISQMGWKKIGLLLVGSFLICVMVREIIFIRIWNNATASISNVIKEEETNLNDEQKHNNDIQREINNEMQNTFESSDAMLRNESKKIQDLQNSF
jgi:hypothetical protein